MNQIDLGQRYPMVTRFSESLFDIGLSILYVDERWVEISPESIIILCISFGRINWPWPDPAEVEILSLINVPPKIVDPRREKDL